MFVRRVISIVAVSMALLTAATAAAYAQPIPGYDQLIANYRVSDRLIYDHDGVLLDRIRTDFQQRRGNWLTLDDVSPALQRAVLYSEDRRFYQHEGIDWWAVAGAAWGNLLQGHRRGASTISMQLVGMLDQDLIRQSSHRSVVQKVDQAWQASALESTWTKAQILEAYLNLAAYRGELIGIDAVSRVLFQKHASGLDTREAALIAVLLRGPNASQRVLVQRACGLLTGLGRPEECRGLGDFTDTVLRRNSAAWADYRSLAPHYSRLVLQQLTGTDRQSNQPVYTSLQADLQQFSAATVQQQLHELHRRSNVSDAAVVVLDNATGKVLAYIGSSAGLSSAARVDHARSLRQAGSTLKPFLYAQAIDSQRLTTVSLLDDSPLNLPTGNGLYIPQNYDKQFSGWVSARTALAASLNIPAVRVLMMVGTQPFAHLLRQLGLPLNQSGDFYGYSLALGSADITLLTLSNAYRTLANHGVYSSLQWLDAQSMATDQQQIIGAEAAWIVGDVLADRQARAATFGLDSYLSTPFWSAVKTGTSKDMRDNWCVGWSQHYTVGVWVGNSSGSSMQDVSGVSGAGPIWHQIMHWLHRKKTSTQAVMPARITRSPVVFQDDIEPAREDMFLGDTVMTQVRLAHKTPRSDSAPPGILSPINGSVFALDPDIPPANQTLALRAADLVGQASMQVFWYINETYFGVGPALDWLPTPGRHRIQLRDAGGKVVQQVTIEVRGVQQK